MLAYLILLVALTSRLLPPLVFGSGMNFTLVGASLLFFGSHRPRWQCGVAVAALAVSDYLLTVYAYHFPFHVRGYLITWLWYAAVCLMGHELLRKVTVLRVAAGAFASATSFFVLSNLVVWMGTMYPHTAAGFVNCYTLALPFYRNDLASTALGSAVLFGMWAIATRQREVDAAVAQPAI